LARLGVGALTRRLLGQGAGHKALSRPDGSDYSTHEVPNSVAANVFTNVGTVEIAEYREPNYPRVMVTAPPANRGALIK